MPSGPISGMTSIPMNEDMYIPAIDLTRAVGQQNVRFPVTNFDEMRTHTITWVMDGGGVALSTGISGDLRVDFDCVIQGVVLLADQSGSVVVDIWVDTLANFPPTNADSITASAPPTISSATNSSDTTLTGWTTAIAAGSILRFNIDSVTSITRLTLALKVIKDLP